MKIEKTDCRNLDRALSLEWLETNGRGGFASGTIAGVNTRRYHALLLTARKPPSERVVLPGKAGEKTPRRYHALLLTARKPPSERVVLVNHLEEWLDVDGEAIPLSANLYPGVVYPTGYEQGIEFSTTPWPTWTFDCHG